jgi:threonine/homoserine/homoserine lactone efflux protein
VAFLGCLFSLIAFGSDVTYALLADLLAVRVRWGGRAAGLRRWLSGGIFVALGVAAAAAHRS